MKFYCIKHLPTDRYMPKTNGHYSYWDPVTNKYMDAIYPPRLFVRYQSAANALSAWLKGIWARDTVTESDGWEYRSYTYVTEPFPKHTPEVLRIRSEIEIVTVQLSEYKVEV